MRRGSRIGCRSWEVQLVGSCSLYRIPCMRCRHQRIARTRRPGAAMGAPSGQDFVSVSFLLPTSDIWYSLELSGALRAWFCSLCLPIFLLTHSPCILSRVFTATLVAWSRTIATLYITSTYDYLHGNLYRFFSHTLCFIRLRMYTIPHFSSFVGF